jgi:hypothetical protein
VPARSTHLGIRREREREREREESESESGSGSESGNGSESGIGRESGSESESGRETESEGGWQGGWERQHDSHSVTVKCYNHPCRLLLKKTRPSVGLQTIV